VSEFRSIQLTFNVHPQYNSFEVLIRRNYKDMVATGFKQTGVLDESNNDLI